MFSCSPVPDIEKLRGRDDYTSWAFLMQMILIQEGTWSAVSGEDVDVEVNDQALATICLGLETYNYSLVRDVTTAKDAWIKLKNAFLDTGLTRRIELLRKLTSARLVNCSRVETYLDEVMSTSHKLSSIDLNIDDSWLAAVMLAGLPEQYEPMIMALEASRMVLTADAVKAKIMQDM